MAATYGFFNSLNGDRTYNADQMSEYFDGLVSNGVYENVGEALQVLTATGMNVSVQPGRAIINCKWFNLDSAETVPIAAAAAALNRYTAVVLRLNMSARSITLTTIDGTPATNPIMPQISNTAQIKDLCLAMVYVAAGATSLTQANITDMRASASCGWVTGLIKQVDTSQLFLQWQTAYEDYYNRMTAAFDGLHKPSIIQQTPDCNACNLAFHYSLTNYTAPRWSPRRFPPPVPPLSHSWRWGCSCPQNRAGRAVPGGPGQ